MVRDLFCRCIEALLVIRFRRRQNQLRCFVCTLGLKTHGLTIPPLDGSETLEKEIDFMKNPREDEIFIVLVLSLYRIVLYTYIVDKSKAQLLRNKRWQAIE